MVAHSLRHLKASAVLVYLTTFAISKMMELRRDRMIAKNESENEVKEQMFNLRQLSKRLKKISRNFSKDIASSGPEFEIVRG
jgi:hypothetical protein